MSRLTALFEYLRTPLPEHLKDSIIIATDSFIVIRDMYPKSIHHYLILPKQHRIDSIYDLNQSDLPFLVDIKALAHSHIISKYPNASFKMGFHAIPSLKPLHLHVISQDLQGHALKTKHHYNSFTTEFFVTIENLMSVLSERGKFPKNDAYYEQLAKRPLECHLCGVNIGNMPKLKAHLLTH